MKNIKIKKAGRPKLNLDNTKIKEEIEKYKNKEQTARQTYINLKIGRTSFYKILSGLGGKNERNDKCMQRWPIKRTI